MFRYVIDRRLKKVPNCPNCVIYSDNSKISDLTTVFFKRKKTFIEKLKNILWK